MNQLKLIHFTFSMIFVFVFCNNVKSQVTFSTDGIQNLLRGNDAIIKYNSHHIDRARMSFHAEGDAHLGAVMGIQDEFGLIDNQGKWFIRSVADLGLTELRANDVTVMTLSGTGKVKIGDLDSTPGDYKLYVDEGILSESLRVAVDGHEDWADFVFDEEFELTPLSEVEAFIDENGHLPNVPSADTMIETGLDVLESDAILLRKIEEAYLYILDQEKQLKELRAEIEKLKS